MKKTHISNPILITISTPIKLMHDPIHNLYINNSAQDVKPPIIESQMVIKMKYIIKYKSIGVDKENY